MSSMSNIDYLPYPATSLGDEADESQDRERTWAFPPYPPMSYLSYNPITDKVETAEYAGGLLPAP